MELIQKIRNITKQEWYNTDEWVKVDEHYVVETLEKHGCPSWDVGLCKLQHYKHKEFCEKRYRLTEFCFATEQITETVFDNPIKNSVQFSWPDVTVDIHIENTDVDIYDGGKYS